MNDKRLTKSCKSHNKPQSSHCLVMHGDAHLNYKRYKVKKPCFNGHPKVHKYLYTHTHYFCVFQKISFFIFFSFIESNKRIKKMQNNAMHESMIPKTDKKSCVKVLL